MENFLIPTLVLWGLTALVVEPLAQASFGSRLAEAGLAPERMASLSEDEQRKWQKIATQRYILWDVVIMGLAGLLGGLAGYYLFGISLRVKGWPGMLTFIGASLLGVSLLTGGRGF